MFNRFLATAVGIFSIWALHHYWAWAYPMSTIAGILIIAGLQGARK